MAMTKPPTSDAAGAVLPEWLISLIGDYGFASRNESDVQKLHRWELLIAGIKRYVSAPQPPLEAGSVGVPDFKTQRAAIAKMLAVWDTSGSSAWENDTLIQAGINLAEACRDLLGNPVWEMCWRPIETAPKDGTDIVVYRPRHDGSYIPQVGSDYWITGRGNGSWGKSRSDTPPVMWMPMPAAPAPKESPWMETQWWLAELNMYGNAKLSDGPHSGRDGAEKAATLLSRLGLAGDRKFAIAEVRLTEPTGQHSPVNEETIGTLNAIGLRPKESP